MNFLIPYLALTAGQSLDTVSTAQAFARGCQEGNAIVYSAAPSPTRLLMTKAVTIGGAAAVMWILQKQGHPKIAQGLGIVSGATGAIAGGWNLRQCRSRGN